MSQDHTVVFALPPPPSDGYTLGTFTLAEYEEMFRILLEAECSQCPQKANQFIILAGCYGSFTKADAFNERAGGLLSLPTAFAPTETTGKLVALLFPFSVRRVLAKEAGSDSDEGESVEAVATKWGSSVMKRRRLTQVVPFTLLATGLLLIMGLVFLAVKLHRSRNSAEAKSIGTDLV